MTKKSTIPVSDITNPTAINSEVLEAKGISKSFGAVQALTDASITLRRGRVTALMGDNGAGKSTLVKALAGVIRPDSGTLRVDGEYRTFSGPADALNIGIETVYQDLSLVNSMAAYENVFLGREEVRTSWIANALGIVNRAKMIDLTEQAIKRIGARIPSVTADVTAMSGGQRQALAVARATLWGEKIVMLDEPTAALGVTESGHVLEIIERLKTQNIAVLMISHNLEHVSQVADDVVVMRRGVTVGHRTVATTSAEEIVGLITGATS